MPTAEIARDANSSGGREMARETSGPLTRVQIFKYVTRDRVLDISDMLNLEARRSKIAFTLLEYGEDKRATTRVRAFADVSDFKLVCWDILTGGFAAGAGGKIFDFGID